ncbi:MAG: UDP-3-O-(3-hydroxymyristoyl)glucosamine N-acyltransferase [Bacteroidetes bacterium]|nr:UDP-3-O-(3-hydroxymyristoyl)glucosamine N-acyltransferase [Bacteroidota bacterium]
MEFKAGQIAEMLGGEVVGDSDATVKDLSPIEAGKSQTLSFLANPAYTEHIYSSKSSVVIVSNDFEAEKDLPENLTLIRVDDARLAFSKLMESYAQMQKPAPGISDSAVIEKGAVIDDSAHVGAMAVVNAGAIIESECVIGAGSIIGKDAQVGSGSLLHENVRVGERCVIGASCTIQPGAIIGGDGFGFAPNAHNEYHKVVHLGNVILEDHVEIGSNTTIDRATLGSTRIGKGVKLDNLIQIAHNVEIGESTVIAAQTGIAGSTKIGKNCMIGGQVGIVGHLTIADGVKIAAQSGIGNSITKEGMIVQGSPAMFIGDFKRSYVHFRNLHKIAEAVEQTKSKDDG